MEILPKKVSVEARWLYAIGAITMLTGLLHALRFTLLTGDQPWFDSRLSIDGPSYIKGMASIAQSGDFLNLSDIYHSPGYQIYLGAIHRWLWSGPGIFRLLKLLNWMMHALCVGMTFVLGEKFLGKFAGTVAGIVLAFSYKYCAYSNLLQYEVLLGFLILLHALLLLAWRPHPVRRAWPHLFLTGLSAAAICLIQVRYIFLVLFGTLYTYANIAKELPVRRKRIVGTSYILAYALPFLMVVGVWSIHHSMKHRELILVSQGSAFRFKTGNSPYALGQAFPYPPIAEPSGARFIISRPGRLLWLMKERFLYFWDIKQDIWYLGPGPVVKKDPATRHPLEPIFYFLSFLVFAGGIIAKIISRDAPASRYAAFYLFSTFLAGIMGPAIIFSSSRFSVPVLPIIFLFQGYLISRMLGFSKPCWYPQN